MPDCASLKSDRYGNCEVQETATVLDEVASRDGAIGYSEATKVDGHEDADRLVKLRIDGREPTAEGVEEAGYPYWQTEFAYTYGEAPAGSIASSFLNYLTQQSGRDILREHGHALCSEVGNSGSADRPDPAPAEQPSTRTEARRPGPCGSRAVPPEARTGR